MSHNQIRKYVHGNGSRRDETIAALTTPPGIGGVAIIRLSGKEALQIASRITMCNIEEQPSHTARLRKLFGVQKRVIDRALVLVMRAPNSYTGEETVEFQCHGGHLIAREVVDSLLYYGARSADPGEFTLRAFLNGKIDLLQAEAIQELIGAKSEEALKIADAHLEGRLSDCIRAFQKEGTRLTAIFEAWVDFPEEGLEFAPFETVISALTSMKEEISKLLSTYRDGKIIHDGIKLSLIGAPNVGKSSLMNALLGTDRAIVSHIAGTTRDLIEEDATFNGVPFRLIDTAGIRQTDEIIEAEGIRRSLQAIDRSDLVLLVLDVTRPTDPEMNEAIDKVPQEKSIIVWNKIDLLQNQGMTLSEIQEKIREHICLKKGQREVFVSTKTRDGFDLLRQAIDNCVWSQGSLPRDEVMITSLRHKQALDQALVSLEKVIQGLYRDESPEFLVFDMKQFLMHLGTVIGTDISEDILTSIFSQFCIGK